MIKKGAKGGKEIPLWAQEGASKLKRRKWERSRKGGKRAFSRKVVARTRSLKRRVSRPYRERGRA